MLGEALLRAEREARLLDGDGVGGDVAPGQGGCGEVAELVLDRRRAGGVELERELGVGTTLAPSAIALLCTTQEAAKGPPPTATGVPMVGKGMPSEAVGTEKLAATTSPTGTLKVTA